jgi:hypothetical protein
LSVNVSAETSFAPASNRRIVARMERALLSFAAS